MIRREANGDAIVFNSLVIIAFGSVNISLSIVGRGIVGPKFNSRVTVSDCFTIVAFGSIGKRPIGAGSSVVSIVGFQFDSFVIVDDSLVIAAFLLVGITSIGISSGIVRFQFDSLVMVSESLVIVFPLAAWTNPLEV